MIKIIENRIFVFLISIFIFYIPAIEFINFNFNNVTFHTIETLNKTTIFLLTISFLLSYFIFKFLKADIFKTFFSFSLVSFLIFNYKNIKDFILNILQIENFRFLGELSLTIIVILTFLIFLFFKKENSKIINFIKIFMLFILLINFYNLFFLYKKNFNLKENHEVFSNLNYFSEIEIEEIKVNQKENIYYFLMDAAIPLESYNKHFDQIAVEKIIGDYETKNYLYIKGTKSNYTGTGLAISQMLNLEYYINEKSPKFNQTHVYPSVMSNIDQSPLKKTLDKIDYDFIWYGNVIANCEMYNLSLCPKRGPNRKISLDLSSMIQSFTSKLNTNYALRNYLQKTPLIDLNNKLFTLERKKLSFLEIAHFENDGIKKFMLFDRYNHNNKKKFTFVHSIMPHGFADTEDYPLVYDVNCSIKKITKNELITIKNQKRRKGGEHIGYLSNYSCMLKRINELIDYLNKNDPKAIVIIQSDHGLLKEGIAINENFSLAKVPKHCQNYLDKKINNINALRLSLSCATNQKVKLLKHKSFDERKNLPKNHKDSNKVFLIE